MNSPGSDVPRRTRTMPNELPPLRSRIAARLVADRGPGKKKLWVLIAIPLGILAGLACLAVLGLYIWLARGLPSIDWARHYRPPIVTTIWSGDEQLIGEFYDERRVVVPYDRIPKRLKQAVIASEDKDFFEHGGVSFTGLMRGIYQTYVRHNRTVGGSTLSQQTAKAIMASVEGEQSVRIRSGWPGVRRDLVARYGNDRLLDEGLKVYATVDLEREHDAVAATIKGVIEADKRQGFRGPLMQVKKKDWDDFIKKEQAFLEGEGKRDEVIAALVTSVEKESAKIRVGVQEGVIPLEQAAWARKPNPELNSEYTKITTLRPVLSAGDVVLVRATEGKGVWALEQDPKLQGALISTDPNSGYVVAMIGGYDFEKSEFNRAFQACRQPGSAFKPVIYSAAIELQGFTASTILLDAPIVADDDSTGRRWKPQNYEEEFKGEVPVRQALIHSMNTPAIRTLQAVGVKAAAAWGHKLGLSTKINEDLSMALGSSCVYPSELTGVFATFARLGKKAKMIYLRRVLDRDGRILEDHSSFYDPWTELDDRVAAGYSKLFDVPEQVMTPETAFLMQQLMTEVCKPPGTGGRAAALGKPVAGKTGTTNDLFDAWFLGYTRDLVTGVWVGYDTYESPMDKYATGGHYALPIWLDYMQKALKGVPQGDFETPSEKIVWVNVDGDTGKRATADTRQPVLEAYLKGNEPPDETGTVATAPGQPSQPQQAPDAAQAADQMLKGGL